MSASVIAYWAGITEEQMGSQTGRLERLQGLGKLDD
jgi:hypothetical protein